MVSGSVYITYLISCREPSAQSRQPVKVALDSGARRLVLLSGRGEEEAQRAEEVLQAFGADWTIVRAGVGSTRISARTICSNH
ncbi:MAG: hypothetical protein R2849_15790 [Thermomicrobiales bacterium]